MVDYYEAFGLDPSMNSEEIRKKLFDEKKVWSRKQNSPDLERRQEAERKIVQIDECDTIFADPDKRKEYDDALMQERQKEVTQQQQYYNQNQYAYNTQTQPNSNRSPYGTSTGNGMSTTATSVIGYLTLVGWLISYFAGDKEGAKIHLNQCLVLYLCQIICTLAANLGTALAVVFRLVQVGLGVLWFIGFIYACRGEQREIPLLGSIHILE